jgi:hypothetical protein
MGRYLRLDVISKIPCLESRLMNRLCWLIRGSIEVFRILFLRKQKDGEQWKY